MDPLGFIGGLVSAGASIFNGVENRNAAQALNDQNVAAQQLYAKNRISWTVADANAAGINPLAALGNATQSYSNVVGDTGMGDSIKSAGHDLGRAIAAQSPTAQRAAELENKLLEAKIANVNADTVKQAAVASEMATKLGQPGTPPGIPLPRPDMRRVGPAYWAKPATEEFVTKTGDIIEAPTAAFSTATQTLAAAPTSAIAAAQLARDNLDHFLNFQMSGARGDAWRAAQPDTSQLQFLGQ